MSKFRKKPVVIEAVRIPEKEEGFDEIVLESPLRDFLRSDNVKGQWQWGEGYASIIIRTLEGDMRATYGDWLILGVKGELYPCKPDIFEATYVSVETTDHE